MAKYETTFDEMTGRDASLSACVDSAAKTGTGGLSLPGLFAGLLLLTSIENALLTGEFWEDGGASFLVVGSIYAVASAVATLIAAAAAKRSEAWTRMPFVYDVLSAGLGLSLIMLLPGMFVEEAAGAVFSVMAATFAAIAYAPMVLSWISLYARLPMRTVFTCFFAAYIGGSLLSWALVVLQPKWMVVGLMVGAAAASDALFRKSQRTVTIWEVAREDDAAPLGESAAGRPAAAAPFPVRPVVICGVVAFVTTFMQNCGPIQDVPLANFAGALLACVILGIFVVRRNLRLVGLQQVSLMMACASALCLPFAGEALGGAGMALSMTANLVFLVFAETVLCGIALRYRFNAPWLVGISVSVMALASLLAVGASTAFRASDLDSQGITLVADVLALVVLALFLRFATETDVLGAWGMEDAGDSSSQTISSEQTVPLRVFELSCRFGFTKREEEVCALLAQGKNVAGIEEALVVSNSTAKSHVAHIYKKMGVHSIQEFRTVFDDCSAV